MHRSADSSGHYMKQTCMVEQASMRYQGICTCVDSSGLYRRVQPGVTHETDAQRAHNHLQHVARHIPGLGVGTRWRICQCACVAAVCCCRSMDPTPRSPAPPHAQHVTVCMMLCFSMSHTALCTSSHTFRRLRAAHVRFQTVCTEQCDPHTSPHRCHCCFKTARRCAARMKRIGKLMSSHPWDACRPCTLRFQYVVDQHM